VRRGGGGRGEARAPVRGARCVSSLQAVAPRLHSASWAARACGGMLQRGGWGCAAGHEGSWWAPGGQAAFLPRPMPCRRNGPGVGKGGVQAPRSAAPGQTHPGRESCRDARPAVDQRGDKHGRQGRGQRRPAHRCPARGPCRHCLGLRARLQAGMAELQQASARDGGGRGQRAPRLPCAQTSWTHPLLAPFRVMLPPHLKVTPCRHCGALEVE
jgi:hypothetical protein